MSNILHRRTAVIRQKNIRQGMVNGSVHSAGSN